MSPPPLVALRGVGVRFANGTEALAGVDLEVGAGEFLSLLGLRAAENPPCCASSPG